MMRLVVRARALAPDAAVLKRRLATKAVSIEVLVFDVSRHQVIAAVFTLRNARLCSVLATTDERCLSDGLWKLLA